MANKKISQIVWIPLTWAIMTTLILSGCNASKPKVYHVGILSGSETFSQIAVGFKARMTELGYIEGQNIIYDEPKATGDPAEQLSIAQKFAQDKVDLIFAFPTDPALAAKTATQGTTIPVVFANGGIQGTGLVNSVREPGGNITGVRSLGPEVMSGRLKFLLEAAPQTKRIYIPYDVNYPLNPPSLEALRSAAASANVTLVEAPVTGLEELKADMQARAESSDIGMDAIMVFSEILTTSNEGFAAINEFAVQHNLPIGGSAATTADRGAIFGYSASALDLGQLAAPLADKIFKGAQAGTIPVVSPEAKLRLNFKRAQELGLTVPEGMLKMADEIIQ